MNRYILYNDGILKNIVEQLTNEFVKNIDNKILSYVYEPIKYEPIEFFSEEEFMIE